jgi:hypothetical protein
MNDEQKTKNFDAADLRAIDRLVDGELDDERRRQVLGSLDYTQDGWRRLALAFVESQTWREDLGDLLRPVDEPPRAARQAGRTARPPRPWMFVLAMAASFSFAFFLAWMFRGDQTRDAGPPQIVGTAPAETTVVKDLILPSVPKPAAEGLAEAGDAADAGGPGDFAQLDDAATLAAESDTAVDVPLMMVGTDGDPWDRVERPALPPRIRQLLERMGHRVQTRRDLIPIQLPNGQRGVVPVEQVEVELNGPEAYQ